MLFDTTHSNGVAVVGGGPAGLMAAEVLSSAGVPVRVFDAMASVGRKLLVAGKGGLNLTHAEPFEDFLSRYRRRTDVEPLLRAFGPGEVRAWAAGLGVETFVSSSGRVFPVGLKASPLLRAWLRRLRGAGVRFHLRHRWLGFGDDPRTLRFATPQGETSVGCDAVVLALGGGSWSKLGSDGVWVALLRERGVEVAPLLPSNCGFDVAGWTEHFRSRFAGAPVKTVALSFGSFHQQGEFVITEAGVEGSLVYAASALLRDEIAAKSKAVVSLDLLPGIGDVLERLSLPRGSRSLATHLKRQLGITGVKAALLHELLPREVIADTTKLAASIHALPLTLVAPRPLDEAISTAGGVRFGELDEHLMLRRLPGVFCAGEMLDWEAPTGGYLLTACLASGVAAASGVLVRPPSRS